MRRRCRKALGLKLLFFLLIENSCHRSKPSQCCLSSQSHARGPGRQHEADRFSDLALGLCGLLQNLPSHRKPLACHLFPSQAWEPRRRRLLLESRLSHGLFSEPRDLPKSSCFSDGCRTGVGFRFRAHKHNPEPEINRTENPNVLNPQSPET